MDLCYNTLCFIIVNERGQGKGIMAGFAQVIVDISVDKLDRPFTYAVPGTLREQVKIGTQVRIPFGKNRIVSGFVIGLSDEPGYDPEKIRSIEGVEEDTVAIEGQLIALADWMHRRYGGTMNQALRTVLPVKKKVRRKEKKTVVLLPDPPEAAELLNVLNRKNHKARARLLSALLEDPRIPYEIVTGKLGVSTQTLKAMEELGIIAIERESVSRRPFSDGLSRKAPVRLNAQQQSVTDGIRQALSGDPCSVSLIHGVTGSGKTEVYMELIADQIAAGRQAILLIPEIALTYQTVMRFYARFGDQISILHSKMSAGERYDQYLKAKNGEISVMIGPRSALFAPFPDLGLIIIDEEHETSYQSENVPRYHAREAAVYRARLSGAGVILGSATPSLTAYYAAQRGRIRLFEMNERVNRQALPQVEIVDLRAEYQNGNKSPFSERLLLEISRRLERGEQCMLFLNRRGMAGFVSCRSCGEVIKCPHCDVSLSVHNNGKMICHYCGYEQPQIQICPACGEAAVGAFRLGTQKLEELTAKMFPQARILRMDADSTREKDGYEKILSAFAAQEADILIGTQMIVKGHDFPNVTLVGVIAADQSLYMPDFTANERSFQLLTQAAGRAGRGNKEGCVIFQTYQPDHFILLDAAAQDYRAFYEEEIRHREILKYPPVWQMMRIQLSSPDEEMLDEAAQKLYRLLAKSRAEQMKGLEVTGPALPPVAKRKDIYYRLIFIKGRKSRALITVKDAVEKYADRRELFQNIGIQFLFE